MNDDTISRQAAILAIEEYADRLQMVNWKENPGVPYKAYALNWAINTLRDLPSAERRGRWKDIEHAPNGLLYATCSVCGKRQTIETTNYCGNCGADMREKKNGCDTCFIPMFYNLEDDDSICRDCEVGE